MNITIEPVTSGNRQAAEQLQVFPEQRGYIESVSECMEEADAWDAWKPVCIVDGPQIVGFAMYGYICEEKYSRVWFDRLLIGREFQHQGYGKKAMQAILSQLNSAYPGEDIYLSVYEDNKTAIALYSSFGFHFNGELDTKGEKVMCLHHG